MQKIIAPKHDRLFLAFLLSGYQIDFEVFCRGVFDAASRALVTRVCVNASSFCD